MVNYKLENGTLVCTFPAKLDTPACSLMEESLIEKVDTAGVPVVFNMEGVTFVCSMFLRICLGIFKQKTKAGFSLQKAAPDVKKVFMIAGFGGMLS